jgi:uncharacterized protein (TIGR03437 family)
MRAVLVLLGALPALAQFAYVQLEPQVIVPGSTQNVLLTTQVTQQITSLVFQWSIVQAPDVPMKDDGTGGDKTAGDGIYSATLPAATIVNAASRLTVFRPPIGFLLAMNGATQLGRPFVVAEIAGPDIPRLPVIQDAADVQHTAYLVNIRMASAYPAAGADPSRLPDFSPVIRRFYQLFPDQFDMLNVVYGISYSQNRYHVTTRNDVQGVGLSIVNNSSAYGSAGALIGVNVFPITAYFDAGETAFVHEFGHQFINFLKLPLLAAGVPHWPISSLASNVMGFSIPGSGAGGQFPCQVTPEGSALRLTPTTDAPVFNDMELYLMGLIPPEQVGTHYVFADQSSTGVISQCTNRLYTAALSTVNMSDVVANAGRRVPDSTASKKNYRVATIIVTRDALLDSDAMALYSYFARRGEEQGRVPVQTGLLQGLAAPMSVATGGRLAVNLQVIPTRLPSIFFGGIANGSSGNAGTYSTTITNAVAPGSFVSIYGEDLAIQTAQAASATLPTTLGGVTVLVNGVAAPLFFVSPGQINFQLPFGVASPVATVVVVSQNSSSSIAWIRVAPAAPGITVFGQNRAAVRNQDTSVNLPDNGAAVGSVISIYGTGIGPVTPAVGSGLPAPLTEFTRAILNVTATIGRSSAPVQFAGLTPGSTALAQVNVTVPNLPPGEYPVTITVGGLVSNGPVITVK